MCTTTTTNYHSLGGLHACIQSVSQLVSSSSAVLCCAAAVWLVLIYIGRSSTGERERRVCTYCIVCFVVLHSSLCCCLLYIWLVVYTIYSFLLFKKTNYIWTRLGVLFLREETQLCTHM